MQPKLSSRACAFDRPGYAWSERAGVVDDGNQVVRDLHEVLLRTNQPRPYVLVGHSLGGLFARLFYDRFPEDVGGMVLLDAAHEEGLFTSIDRKPIPITSLSEAEYLAANVPSLPPRVPAARLEDAYRRLPEDIQQLHLALLTRFLDNMKSATVPEMIAFQKASYATLMLFGAFLFKWMVNDPADPALHSELVGPVFGWLSIWRGGGRRRTR